MRFLAYISLFFMIFTSLIGIHTLVKAVTKRIFDKSKTRHYLRILPLRGETEELECVIRDALDEEEPLVIIDCGLSDEAKSTVWRMHEDNPALGIITPELLKEYVEGIQV